MPTPLLTFVEELLVTGRVRQTTDESPNEADITEAVGKVVEFEKAQRLDLPWIAPTVDQAVLRWALVAFYHTCQFQVYRHLGISSLSERFTAELPRGSTARAHYSVDLVFRFLPGLVKLARSGSPEDPLLETLTAWCEA